MLTPSCHLIVALDLKPQQEHTLLAAENPDYITHVQRSILPLSLPDIDKHRQTGYNVHYQETG